MMTMIAISSGCLVLQKRVIPLETPAGDAISLEFSPSLSCFSLEFPAAEADRLMMTGSRTCKIRHRFVSPFPFDICVPGFLFVLVDPSMIDGRFASHQIGCERI